MENGHFTLAKLRYELEVRYIPVPLETESKRWRVYQALEGSGESRQRRNIRLLVGKFKQVTFILLTREMRRIVRGLEEKLPGRRPDLRRGGDQGLMNSPGMASSPIGAEMRPTIQGQHLTVSEVAKNNL